MPGEDYGVLSQTLGFHVARSSVLIYGLFDTHIGKPTGLRKVEFSLLMLLLANEAMAPKRLAALLSLTAPALTMVLDRMQDKGLIRRQPNPLDGRSHHIRLTAEGGRLARKLEPEARAMEAQLLQNLSRAEHAMLIELLVKAAGGAPVR